MPPPSYTILMALLLTLTALVSPTLGCSSSPPTTTTTNTTNTRYDPYILTIEISACTSDNNETICPETTTITNETGRRPESMTNQTGTWNNFTQLAFGECMCETTTSTWTEHQNYGRMGHHPGRLLLPSYSHCGVRYYPPTPP